MTLRNYSSTAAETTLSGSVDASTTTLTVSGTTGFPATPFVLAIDAGAAAQELVLVTNVAGTTLTVTRAFDSTVASAHDTGAVVAHSHAAIDFREANAHVNAENGVHGATGDVVGTSDTQTLTNKTVALGSNTVSGTKAQFNAAMTDADFATLTGTETLTNKTLTAPAATGSLAGFGGAWTEWTPTVTAESGAFGSASGAGRYIAVGKLIIWSAEITITTVGTASGGVRMTLPVNARAANLHLGAGRENASTGVQLEVFAATAALAHISRYDNTTAIGAGWTLILGGTYEAA